MISSNEVEATYISNQSTGYCPRPESWFAIALALDKAGIERPDDFSVKFIFRRCVCGQINIVKDEIFECGVCHAKLP